MFIMVELQGFFVNAISLSTVLRALEDLCQIEGVGSSVAVLQGLLLLVALIGEMVILASGLRLYHTLTYTCIYIYIYIYIIHADIHT